MGATRFGIRHRTTFRFLHQLYGGKLHRIRHPLGVQPERTQRVFELVYFLGAATNTEMDSVARAVPEELSRRLMGVAVHTR